MYVKISVCMRHKTNLSLPRWIRKLVNTDIGRINNLLQTTYNVTWGIYTAGKDKL